MVEPEPLVTFKQTGNVQIISIAGSLIDRLNVQRIRKRIASQLEGIDQPQIVVCFDQVKEVSSAILGALLEIDKQVRGSQGRLCLAGMSASVAGVFQLTRLDSILEIHDSIEAAVKSFG
jgi:anti-sigma B factor antagonist